CLVDEFGPQFWPQWDKTLLSNGWRKRPRQTILPTAEIMTIVIHFHQSHDRQF
ncbi:IS982 family transposase, partial [Candidatus Poribacteria bacterium]|nr:IS982 family transposase [Candidatus Poribacteria bacterium]